jgi:DNA ligase-1
MRAFAELLDRLVYMPSRNGKLKLIADYLAAVPDPDRGYALAALTGGLAFPAVKRSAVVELVDGRVDPVLFRLSRDYVGDTAETVALIWPARAAAGPVPSLTTVVETLAGARRGEAGPVLEAWLDVLAPKERWALIKLVTGGFRIGVSSRLAKQALARFGDVDVTEIEELWHGLEPPYAPLFAWLEGRSERPEIDDSLAFRPMMLANPIEDRDLAKIDPRSYLAEWKWDGIRVQIAARRGEVRLYSRTGDEIAAAFPDIADHCTFDAVLDGELLVTRDGQPAPFNDLQQRLNRKTVTARMLKDHPAHVRLYDLLLVDGDDLRTLPLVERRARLEIWYADVAPRRMDLSPLIAFPDIAALKTLRGEARERGIEGLMLKRRDSAYVAGRPKGPWFKWKRDPHVIDAVLMYAQRGSGKRSSFYSDYTFGAWRDGADGAPELVPVGKAYFGFTDEELLRIDRWVRANTTNSFGPVREVIPGLVFEVAFDAVHPSPRHKSGIAMRFPRVHRIRWDKPAGEADRLETLEAMMEIER